MGCEVPLVTVSPEIILGADDLHVGSRHHPNRLRDGRTLEQGRAGVLELQREVAKRIGSRDVERNFEETVAVGEVHARSSVKRPGVVHRGVANGLERIVHQLGLDGGVGVAVKAWERGG